MTTPRHEETGQFTSAAAAMAAAQAASQARQDHYAGNIAGQGGHAGDLMPAPSSQQPAPQPPPLSERDGEMPAGGGE